MVKVMSCSAGFANSTYSSSPVCTTKSRKISPLPGAEALCKEAASTTSSGADGVKENGKRAYSSYLALSAPFKLGGLDWTVDLGMIPWETTFYNGYTSGFCVTDISLGASKEIKITDSFSVPTFAKVTVNPRTEGAYFAFGLSF